MIGSHANMFMTDMSYHQLYVPLLLQLCNDVETNPGPAVYHIVDPNLTVCADFSQGDSNRFGPSAGKQCVAMSITAIVYSQIENVNSWNSSSLNNILLQGNILYVCISNSINKPLLLLTDVPELISAEDIIYSLQYSESFTGELCMTSSNEPFFSLEDTFSKIFLSSQLNYNYALLTIGINSVAIFKISNFVFKVFDSHLRDLYGMPHSFGKCVLLTIDNIANLVTHFQTFSSSHEEIVPFEMKGVNIYLNAPERQNANEYSTENQLNELSSITRNKESETSKYNGKMLTKRQQYYRQRLRRETPEMREKRLSRQRDYQR